MLKHIYRVGMAIFVLIDLVCLLLLLNVTAPNPTGRRYSSLPVATAGEIALIGSEGERVLGLDLKLVNNNQSGKYTLCGITPSAKIAPTCLVKSPNIQNYRIPDFVSDRYIIDSKNSKSLSITQARNYDQLREMSIGAQELGRELWIFVRVNTVVSPEIVALAKATGGDVVNYFAYAGYQDPVDTLATVILIICTLLLLIGLSVRLVRGRKITKTPSPTTNPRDTAMPIMQKAEVSADTASQFFRKTELKSRLIIDIEESKNDKPTGGS